VSSVCGIIDGNRSNTTMRYSPMATLSMTSAYNVIRLCMTRNVAHDLLPWPELLTYFLFYGVGAAYCVGMFVASGVVIPTLVIGATGGHFLAMHMGPQWADPGLMALVGMASFFAGLSRLTIAVAVITAEISNDLHHVVLFMLGIVVSKLVADRLCRSLYQLAARGRPLP
jgi:H+/Cl- antiporter ClcA